MRDLTVLNDKHVRNCGHMLHDSRSVSNKISNVCPS